MLFFTSPSVASKVLPALMFSSILQLPGYLKFRTGKFTNPAVCKCFLLYLSGSKSHFYLLWLFHDASCTMPVIYRHSFSFSWYFPTPVGAVCFAKFKQLQVIVLPVQVMNNAFQSGFQHRGAHDVQFGTQAVDHFYRSLQNLIVKIGAVGNGVGEYFVETIASKIVARFSPLTAVGKPTVSTKGLMVMCWGMATLS